MPATYTYLVLLSFIIIMEGKQIKLGEVFNTYEQFVRIFMNNYSEQNYVGKFLETA